MTRLVLPAYQELFNSLNRSLGVAEVVQEGVLRDGRVGEVKAGFKPLDGLLVRLREAHGKDSVCVPLRKIPTKLEKLKRNG